MQGTGDEDDGFSFFSQLAGLVDRSDAWVAELVGDLPPAVELGQVLGGRNRGHDHRLLEHGLADREQLDLGRLLGQLFEVGLDLGVVGELAVIADLVAEELVRRRLGGQPTGGQEDDRKGERDPGHDGGSFHRDLLRKIEEVYLSPGAETVKANEPARTIPSDQGMESASWATRSMPWTGTP